VDTYNDKPKRSVEQIDIWFSKYNQAWVTCAWIVVRHDSYHGKDTYQKEKVMHPTFKEAVEYLSKNYVGSKS
jgi:hypothetical protein